MHRIIKLLALSTAIIGTAAWAGDYDQSAGQADEEAGMEAEMDQDTEMSGEQDMQEPGTVSPEPGVTVTRAKEAEGGYLKDEIIGIKPQVGVLVFKDALSPGQDTTTRGAAGLTLDMNAATLINENMERWFIGPSTGVIYSHLGGPDAGFFGTTDAGGVAAGSNFFFIPADLKLGVNLAERYRVAVHGGGNVTYRSIPASMNLGGDNAGQTTPGWDIYPNVGADFEANLGRNIALLARPDVTFTPGDEFFTGTLALAIPLG
ncbi:MAG: hypothetical protein A3K03_05025 [Bdellovibrionales bacterium RIFOXYD1_FULL_44_7]|nr:MAG: hypothetical protein A3K03_05025 [Bdellovibrionales bacterium RIFOXYD1_FULL_44_7]